MSSVERADGVEIHWEVRGDGPLVLIAPPLWSSPEVYAELAAELADDHRVAVYDQRGCGRSSRRGPYEVETDAADLAAVSEAAGGEAVAIAVGNTINYAARAAVAWPGLVSRVAAVGPAGGMLPRSQREGSGVLASDSVVEMLLRMINADPRAAAHAMIAATNPQLAEDGLRERVDRLAAYSSPEAAAGRARAWAEDDVSEQLRALDDRLWILNISAEPMFETALAERAAELFPMAHLDTVADGPISHPDLTTGAVRRITATAPTGY